MSRRKFREAATAVLLTKLLANIDSSSFVGIPDDIADLTDIDEDWTLVGAMHCEEAPESRRSVEERPIAEPISGRKPITIRVPNRVLQAFRKRAENTGTAYQTLINRTLRDAVDAFD